jgi:hypothetical protein
MAYFARPVLFAAGFENKNKKWNHFLNYGSNYAVKKTKTI